MAAPPGTKKAREHHHAAREERPVARHVELRERHVRRADLQRQHEVPEAADGQRHDAEEHHDGAVHGAELVVELGEHDAAGGALLAQPLADQRNGLAGVGDLPAHQQHQHEAEQQEEQSGHGVLDADHLVIDGEDVRLPEPQLVVLVLAVCVVSVRVRRVGGMLGGRHVSQRRDSFRAASRCVLTRSFRWEGVRGDSVVDPSPATGATARRERTKRARPQDSIRAEPARATRGGASVVDLTTCCAGGRSRPSGSRPHGRGSPRLGAPGNRNRRRAPTARPASAGWSWRSPWRRRCRFGGGSVSTKSSYVMIFDDYGDGGHRPRA